jgi:hypothetical protein
LAGRCYRCEHRGSNSSVAKNGLGPTDLPGGGRIDRGFQGAPAASDEGLQEVAIGARRTSALELALQT